jgi:hypothetical protein
VSDPPATSPNAPAGFLKAALGRIASNLELFLGKPLVLSPAEPAAATGAELADRLPARGLALGVKVSGAVDAEIHCVASLPLTLAMALHAKHRTDAQVSERLSGPSDLTDSERDGIKETGSFITAALGDFAKEATGGRIVLAPAEAKFCARGEDSPWPPTESGFGLETTIEVGGAPPSLLVLFVPATVVAAWTKAAPAPAFEPQVERPKTERPKTQRRATERPRTVRPRTAGPAPAPAAPAAAPSQAPPPVAAVSPVRGATAAPAVATWVAGTEAFARAVQAAGSLALEVKAYASLGDAVAAAGPGSGPALLVVEIAPGSEFEIDLVGALRRHPAFAATRLMVALAAPTRTSVLRCGSLGILDVIPAALDAQALSERLLGVARGRPAAKPR